MNLCTVPSPLCPLFLSSLCSIEHEQKRRCAFFAEHTFSSLQDDRLGGKWAKKKRNDLAEGSERNHVLSTPISLFALFWLA